MNILFSDEFADDFGGAGDTPSQAEIDSGDARNNRGFRIRVQAAFIQPHPVYDKLQFSDDKHFVNSAINPGKNIQQHSWKKLRGMWMDVNSQYKMALHNFTKSGEHENDFINFVDGKMAVYYLRKYLNLKPGLNEAVRAGLPVECEIESDKPVPASATSTSNSEPTSARKPKRSQSENYLDAVQAIKQLDDPPEIKKRRQEMLESEEARRAHTALVYEYKEIQQMIKELRQSLKEEGIDDDEKTDLQEDVKRLKKKKNEIATQLGY